MPKVSAASRIITSRPATTSSRDGQSDDPGAHDHTRPDRSRTSPPADSLTFSGNGVRSGHGAADVTADRPVVR